MFVKCFQDVSLVIITSEVLRSPSLSQLLVLLCWMTSSQILKLRCRAFKFSIYVCNPAGGRRLLVALFALRGLEVGG